MGYQAIQGATTVGLVCSDGVVLASDKRVSWGYLISSRSGKKVFKLTDNIGLAFAGLMSDMQALIREAEAYANLFRLEKGRPITTKAMSKLVSNMLFNRRMMPLLMETLVGGVDPDGPQLYSMDLAGSLIPDDYITAGSGSPIAMGVLEADYSKGLDCEAGSQLAIKAIKAAIARDAVSGDGIDLLIIRAGGSEERTLPFRST
ncbi:proteasome endopeptidase complex, archaeal, beta subunit [Candidatus Bathyarchaeota archaeon RBG_16_57_9]|nr:MAG: proteasome endopeptidase complex, archaeal, beta subunit [Candidatus Bathyarchaeota archaeon RBG_16_57_9]OGD54630.1 MAG: proteasome endopeptidase complex, archaeal, beta subunit [Candidatus Bathyarchaeota archaeon RBG_13_60_20]